MTDPNADLAKVRDALENIKRRAQTDYGEETFTDIYRIALDALSSTLLDGDHVIVPRERLEGLNRMLSPGSRTLDELCRDMGYACDTVRALLSGPEQEQKP